MENNYEEGEVNPILLEFLDTDSFEEKYKILVATPIMDFDNLLIEHNLLILENHK